MSARVRCHDCRATLAYLTAAGMASADVRVHVESHVGEHAKGCSVGALRDIQRAWRPKRRRAARGVA